MAEYINRKILADLVLSKLKFMGDARIMNQNDEKVLSEIDGYEKAINAVHELILDKDLIENVQPMKHGMWRTGCNESLPTTRFVCSECDGLVIVSTYRNSCMYNYCPNCGARMDGENNE